MSSKTLANASEAAWLSNIQFRFPMMLEVHLRIAHRERTFGDMPSRDLPAEIDESVVIAMCPEKLSEIALNLFVTDEVREILERAQLRGVNVAAAVAALPPPRDPPIEDDLPWGS